MQRSNKYSETLRRLNIVLRRLATNGVVFTKNLSEEFEVSIRTIQKDIRFLQEHFPIEKGAIRGSYRFKRGFTLHESELDHEEMVVLLFSLKPLEASEHLREIGEEIIKKTLRQKYGETPMIVKGEGIEDFDLESWRNKRLLEAIEKRRVVYAIDKEGDETEIEPYKIINFEGIWYLFGRDLQCRKLDIWMLADIEKIQHSHESFHLDEKAIEKTIEEKVHSPWYEEGSAFDVIVKVSPKIAHYFRLRPLIKTQRILDEEIDGSMKILFRVTHDEDIDNLVKAWLPDIEVLEPHRYREKLLSELQSYLKRMEDGGRAS